MRTRCARGSRTLGSEKARKELYSHPLVAGLIRQKGSRIGRSRLKKIPLVKKLPTFGDERYPSYLPAQVVVTALLHPADGSRPLLANALGLGMTAVALTLGAPFWFDLLKKVANIRAAGKAPSERPVEKPAEAGEPSAPARGE